ncbi:MAG: alpha/beta hydrolase [Sulfurospirillum sp.]|nr:alpha/beta hydrolase [Sulfurospirillum sp.]
MAIKEIIYKEKRYSIAYELTGAQHQKTIVFLHGWGSNKEIMRSAFGRYFNDCKHIYLDLPGFGNSSIVMPLDTQAYAQIIALFLEALHVSEYTAVGHSFGGKVATLLDPCVLVLLSSAGIVVPKTLKVRSKIKFFKLFKHMLPKNMALLFASKDVSGMSQVMYETFKRVVDEDFSVFFGSREKKSFIFWGKDDRATPLFCGKKIASLMKNSHFYPLDGDHFFFMKHATTIENEIQKRL